MVISEQQYMGHMEAKANSVMDTKNFLIEFIVVFHTGCLEDLRMTFERFCQKAGLIKRPKKTAVVS